MIAFLVDLARLLRPRQWPKNVFVFAGLAFGQLSNGAYVLQHQLSDSLPRVALAVLAFTALSGAVYVLNDLRDLRRDRLHPVKRQRPLASGRIPRMAAAPFAGLLLVTGFVAFRALSTGLLVLGATYVAINTVYTLWWKRVVILDVFCVASGFVLRVVAGVLAAGAVLRPWILLCTMFLALLISLGKRRGEIVLLGEESGNHRATLAEYPLPFIDMLIVGASAMTVITYALFTIESGRSPYLLVTVPFVLYGTFRYLYLLYVRRVTEAFETLMLRDRPLLAVGAIWAAVVALLFMYA